MRSIWLGCVGVLILAVSGWSEDIAVFDANSVISSGQDYDTVVVRGAGTVVRIEGGTVQKLIVMETARVEMSGGQVTEGFAYDASILEVAGGEMPDVAVYGTATFVLTGSGDCTLIRASESEARVVMDSATAHTGSVSLTGAVLELRAGWAESVNVAQSATADIRGGQIDYLNVERDGQAFLQGGEITSITFWYAEPGYAYVIGHDLTAVPYGGTFGNGRVEGFWNDDQAFVITLADPAGYAFVRLYDGIVPPRCTDPPEADTTGDCKVDLEDLLKLAAEWLTCGLENPDDC